ncbi:MULTISPECIES: glycosyl hydrolase-related protein [Paenibacillus]|uniref:Glycoside hydrolase family 38 N-terminal domain-containing protein n=1 Tax=Paenibacillus lautus TaxID=1401 RepID=A0A1R1B147_PAELA|nr:glycosyl hydrolase-related protein [Paenibacillus lautus]OME92245.1 hypothetical protein BK123_16700 [Paenibacillus lautus]
MIKEILVLHHSHLDIGYTHTQPVALELHRDYIDQAIDLCEQTEHLPETERFRWTLEATYPVMKWLESTSEHQVERFERYLKNGQICIAAMSLHTTPLCNAEQLARMLYPVRYLRERFGISLNTAINHDINGQPWALSQMMIDAGIELYTTGINTHFGGIPFRRPGIFRWQTPDGRELLTFNGEHYSMLTQIGLLWKKDTRMMKEGLDNYMNRILEEGYKQDFIYISATNTPMMDNSQPDYDLMEMVARWNEEGHEQKIRLVTPEMLLEKLKSIPKESIPVHAGDWTDYWNFGAASSAFETKLNRRTKAGLRNAEFMEAFQPQDHGKRYSELLSAAWENLNLYDEHTWGADESIWDPDSVYTRTSWAHKSHYAYQANSLSQYISTKQLESFTGNPYQSGTPDGLLLVNPTHIPIQYDARIPIDFNYERGRHTAANRYKVNLNNYDTDWTKPSAGVVEVPAFGWKIVPFNRFGQKVSNDIVTTETTIESCFYKCSFDPSTGRIQELFDKINSTHVLDSSSEWSFFQFVHESIDPMKQAQHRSTLFPRELEKCNNSISCWNHQWPARRTGADKLVTCEIIRHDSGVTLLLKWEAPSVNGLEQKITFFADRPGIELIASFHKQDIRKPESIYFTFPLQLNAGWRAKFDSAGTFVELDDEQIPGVCRDWVTVDQTVSVFDGNSGVTLACPDAPLVQVGDFNFGKEQGAIPRTRNPLLLAWPVNNYWDTNFRASQPGLITVKYVLHTFKEFNAVRAAAHGIEASAPVQIHPVVYCSSESSGSLLEVQGEQIVTLHVKRAEDKQGIIIRLGNMSDSPSHVSISLPNQEVKGAYVNDLLEKNVAALEISKGIAKLQLQARAIATIRIQ